MMYKANDMLGKTVINQATGERSTTVSGLIFSADSSKVVALLANGGFLSSPRVMPWSEIVSIGDVVIVSGNTAFTSLKDNPQLNELHKSSSQITGTRVINDSGSAIGTVSDVYFNERGVVEGYELKQSNLFSGHKVLLTEQVQTIGKDAIISLVTSEAALSTARELERERKSTDGGKA